MSMTEDTRRENRSAAREGAHSDPRMGSSQGPRASLRSVLPPPLSRGPGAQPCCVGLSTSVSLDSHPCREGAGWGQQNREDPLSPGNKAHSRPTVWHGSHLAHCLCLPTRACQEARFTTESTAGWPEPRDPDSKRPLPHGRPTGSPGQPTQGPGPHVLTLWIGASRPPAQQPAHRLLTASVT